MSFDLNSFETDNYGIEISDSAVRDFEGEVYHVVNKLTGVSEHETPYFSEALGYVLALDKKMKEAIDLFHEKRAEDEVGVPGDTVH